MLHGQRTHKKAREGKGRQGKAREGKGRQGKAREGKGRQGKAWEGWLNTVRDSSAGAANTKGIQCCQCNQLSWQPAQISLLFVIQTENCLAHHKTEQDWPSYNWLVWDIAIT